MHHRHVHTHLLRYWACLGYMDYPQSYRIGCVENFIFILRFIFCSAVSLRIIPVDRVGESSTTRTSTFGEHRLPIASSRSITGSHVLQSVPDDEKWLLQNSLPCLHPPAKWCCAPFIAKTAKYRTWETSVWFFGDYSQRGNVENWPVVAESYMRFRWRRSSFWPTGLQQQANFWESAQNSGWGRGS